MLKPCFTPSTALRYTRTTKTHTWGQHLCRAHASSSWEFVPAPQREEPRHKRIQRGSRGRDYRDQRERREFRERRDYRDRNRGDQSEGERDNYREVRKYGEGRNYRERDYRGNRDQRDERDYRGNRDQRDERDYRGNRGQRDERDYRGNRGQRDERDYRNNRDDRMRRDSRPPSTNPESEIIRAAQATSDDLLYGVNAVLQALLTRKRAHYTRLYVQTGSTDRVTHTRIKKHANEAGIPITGVSKHGLNMLSDNRPHQGVILSTAGFDIPLITNLEDCKGVWLALDEVTDPHNVGAIMRSAVFLGARGVILCKRNCCGVTAAVAKASSGAVEICDVRCVGSMPRFLKNLKEQDWQVLGLGVGGTGIRDVNIENDGVVMVLGSEGKGLRKIVADCCDEIVGIDGSENDVGQVDSLNVSVAAGVALFELLRAR